MAAALVQHLGEQDRNGTFGATVVITVASLTVTAGNTIVAGFVAYDTTGTTPTCADNLGNTYSLIERTDGIKDSAIFSAPVTSAGTLTSITFTVGESGTTRYTAAEAAEFSGVGALSEAGGGTAASGGTTQTGIVNKAIPADGLAVWFTGGNTNQSYTAGAASGTPSTSPTLIDAHASANMSAGLLYALGGTGVTGFTGNTGVSGTGDYASSGALFGSSIVLQAIRPDADVTTTGWATAPLWSKIEESSADGTVITGTAA